jgi:hypothetical protein
MGAPLGRLREGDPFDVVRAVWLAKEHLRDVYLSEDPAEAERLLGAVIAECDAEDIPELVTLATTLRRWRSEILAPHVTDASNGPTEVETARPFPPLVSRADWPIQQSQRLTDHLRNKGGPAGAKTPRRPFR